MALSDLDVDHIHFTKKGYANWRALERTNDAIISIMVGPGIEQESDVKKILRAFKKYQFGKNYDICATFVMAGIAYVIYFHPPDGSGICVLNIKLTTEMEKPIVIIYD